MHHVSTALLASLLCAGLLAGCSDDDETATTAFRVHQDQDGREVELLVADDRIRFTIHGGGETLVMVIDGNRGLVTQHEGTVPGPDSEYRIYEDWSTTEGGHEMYVVDDGEAPVQPFQGPCTRAGSGTFAGREAVRFTCRPGETARAPDMWVDEETGVVLTPWGIEGEVQVDPDHAVEDADEVFSLEPPDGVTAETASTGD